jgi:recombination protein RecA
VERKLIEKSGAWFSYKGERLGQGRENAKLFIREHPDIAAALEAKLREMLGLAKAPAALADKGKAG